MEICFHIVSDQNNIKDKEFFVTNTMTTNVTWPKDIGDLVQPTINYTDFFNTSLSNTTTSLRSSFDDLGGDNTTAKNLTKWCLQSSSFGDYFQDDPKNGTKYTLTVNIIMNDLKDGDCKDRNYD
jgi:hypothetical protein